MKLPCCYILWSDQANHYYVGACHDDLQARIKKHNDSVYGGKAYTSFANDWKLIYVIECKTISQAKRIESHIKRMKSKVHIENLCKYKEMTEKLMNLYAG